MRLEYLLIRDKGFKIFADHKNLLFLFDPSYRPTNLKKFTVAKLERWSLRLHALPFSIEHIDGVKNVWADLLSRWGAKKPLTAPTIVNGPVGGTINLMDKQRPLPPSQVDSDPVGPVGSAVVSNRTICTDTTSPNKDAMQESVLY